MVRTKSIRDRPVSLKRFFFRARAPQPPPPRTPREERGGREYPLPPYFFCSHKTLHSPEKQRPVENISPTLTAANSHLPPPRGQENNGLPTAQEYEQTHNRVDPGRGRGSTPPLHVIRLRHGSHVLLIAMAISLVLILPGLCFGAPVAVRTFWITTRLWNPCGGERRSLLHWFGLGFGNLMYGGLPNHKINFRGPRGSGVRVGGGGWRPKGSLNAIRS